MKKSILAVGIAFAMLHASSMPVRAADNATVIFTDEKKLEYRNVTSDGSEVKLGSAFEGVAPGETRSETITLQNQNNRTADFYMSAEAVRALEEDAAQAKGAGYDIKLTVGKTVLYDSTVGGYDSTKEDAASKLGLSEMNQALKEDILIATLAHGETTDVVLTIWFDGEAMDNTTVIDYSETAGQLAFDFKVGYEEPTGVETIYKVVTRQGETRYVKKRIEIFENAVPLAAVATGDTARVGIGVAVLAAGILLLLLGKKKRKFPGGLLIAVLLCMPALSVQAEDLSGQTQETYTVTFRPGNVGYFALTEEESGTRQEMALSVAKLTYGSHPDYNFEVTEHGAIKVRVPAHGKMPQAPVYIRAEAGYFVKDSTLWGPSCESVDKNMDFVVDYGKLVSGVEYTVKYVDDASGESIAPVYIAQANAGEVRTVTAPEQIVISEKTVYRLSSKASLELVLKEDAKENVCIFRYTMDPRGTVVEEVVDYVDGGVVTTTETVVTYVNSGQTAANASTGQGSRTIREEQTPLEPAALEEESTQPGEQDFENQDAENPAGNPEDEQPAGDEGTRNEGETGIDNTVTIEEGEVPLMDFEVKKVSYAAKVGAGIFVAAAMAAGAVWIRWKRKQRQASGDTEEPM